MHENAFPSRHSSLSSTPLPHSLNMYISPHIPTHRSFPPPLTRPAHRLAHNTQLQLFILPFLPFHSTNNTTHTLILTLFLSFFCYIILTSLSVVFYSFYSRVVLSSRKRGKSMAILNSKQQANNNKQTTTTKAISSLASCHRTFERSPIIYHFFYPKQNNLFLPVQPVTICLNWWCRPPPPQISNRRTQH